MEKWNNWQLIKENFKCDLMESSRYLGNESLFEKRMFILNLEEKESTTWKLKKKYFQKADVAER